MRQLPASAVPAAGRGVHDAPALPAWRRAARRGRSRCRPPGARSRPAPARPASLPTVLPARPRRSARRAAPAPAPRGPRSATERSAPRSRAAAARRRAGAPAVAQAAGGRRSERKQQSAAASAAVHAGVSGSATMTSGRGPGSARSRLRSSCDSSGSSQASSTRGTWRAGTSVMCRAALQSPAGDRRCPRRGPGCTGFYCHAAQAASGNKEDRVRPAIAGAAASR